MIRDKKKAQGFNDIGVKTVIGDFKSVDLIRDESAKADLVISIGDCDDTVSVGAMIEGLAKHKAKDGKPKPFYHTVSACVPLRAMPGMLKRSHSSRAEQVSSQPTREAMDPRTMTQFTTMLMPT